MQKIGWREFLADQNKKTQLLLDFLDVAWVFANQWTGSKLQQGRNSEEAKLWVHL